MPKTVQIRNLDDDVYAALSRRAAETGVTVPEMLAREATRLATQPTLEWWPARMQRRTSSSSPEEITAALDEHRGSWPD